MDFERYCWIHPIYEKPCPVCKLHEKEVAEALRPPEIMKHPDETDAEYKVRALAHHRSRHAD